MMDSGFFQKLPSYGDGGDDTRSKASSKRSKRNASQNDNKDAKAAKMVVSEKLQQRARHEGRDGRSCTLCGIKDSAADLIVATMLIMWAYTHVVSVNMISGEEKYKFTPNGIVCFYCQRVFRNVYAAKHKTIANLKTAWGRTPALMTEFKSWREFVVGKLKEAGSHNAAIRFNEEANDRAQEITKEMKDYLRLEAPKECFVHIEDYQFGDPKLNGLGHTECVHPATGPPAVKFLKNKIWTRK